MVERRARFRIAVALVVAVAAVSAPAQESEVPRVEIAVSPIEATVGDRLETTLSIVVPAETHLERPRLGPELGPFVVDEISWEGPEAVDDGVAWVWRGTLAAFETGTLEVPSVTIRIGTGDDATVVRTEPVEVRIQSVLPAGEENPAIADLKPPVSLPADYGALLAAVGVLGGLLVLAGLAWWLHRRLAPRLAAVPASDDPFHRMPPHEWVYEQLRLLLDRRLAEEGKVAEFFEELSRIVKQYLGGRYRVDLLERTTAELPAELAQAGAVPGAVRAAIALLERCDMVKFARSPADPTECRDAVEDAYRIVDITRPAVAGPDSARGAA